MTEYMLHLQNSHISKSGGHVTQQTVVYTAYDHVTSTSQLPEKDKHSTERSRFYTVKSMPCPAHNDNTVLNLSQLGWMK